MRATALLLIPGGQGAVLPGKTPDDGVTRAEEIVWYAYEPEPEGQGHHDRHIKEWTAASQRSGEVLRFYCRRVEASLKGHEPKELFDKKLHSNVEKYSKKFDTRMKKLLAPGGELWKWMVTQDHGWENPQGDIMGMEKKEREALQKEFKNLRKDTAESVKLWFKILKKAKHTGNRDDETLASAPVWAAILRTSETFQQFYKTYFLFLGNNARNDDISGPTIAVKDPGNPNCHVATTRSGLYQTQAKFAFNKANMPELTSLQGLKLALEERDSTDARVKGNIEGGLQFGRYIARAVMHCKSEMEDLKKEYAAAVEYIQSSSLEAGAKKEVLDDFYLTLSRMAGYHHASSNDECGAKAEWLDQAARSRQSAPESVSEPASASEPETNGTNQTEPTVEEPDNNCCYWSIIITVLVVLIAGAGAVFFFCMGEADEEEI